MTTTTATTTTIDLTHPVRVLHDDRPDSLGYRAECGCGWVDIWQTYQVDAEADARDHREVAVGPGDGLDGLMSELLDIQDDLASVVVWLAENWSADLPVPKLRLQTGGPIETATVEMSVNCLNAATLGRIAHLLGVPARDETTPGRSRTRYWTARRRFGRVSLRAFTVLRDVEPGQ